MTIDKQIQLAGRDRRGAVRLMLIGVALITLAFAASLVVAVGSGDAERVAGTAGGTWWLGMLVPLLVVALAAVTQRGPGVWLWFSLLVGALITASGPMVVLLVHGSWDAEVWLPGRWGSGSGMSLVAFSWLSWVTAACLLIGGVVGLILQRRRTPE